MIERKKKEEMLEELMFGILFGAGVLSSTLLGLWVLEFYFYVFGNAAYVGDIAFIPKWIFIGAPLIFLIETEPVKRLIERIERMGGKGPRNFA